MRARLAFALLVAIAGLACDLFAESLFIGWLPYRTEAIAALARHVMPQHAGRAAALISIRGPVGGEGRVAGSRPGKTEGA